MTRVTYSPEDYCLEIEGHAGQARAGQDVVCAGISTLAFTLIAALNEEKGRFRPQSAQNKSKAYLRIRCNPADRYHTPCRRLMTAFALGMEMIAKSWPENVQYREL